MIPPDGQVRIQAIGIVLADETKPLRASIDALQARIAELENELKEREHKVDWREGVQYKKHNTVTLGGSQWTALADNCSRPTTDNPAWHLSISRGRDGKNGHVVAEPRKPTQERTYGR
jgi:hypothetical protein